VNDEPVLGPAFGANQDAAVKEQEIVLQIEALLDGEPFAVLCTQGEGQPYGSLVAFAFTKDLRCFVFATPRATRKYSLLCECKRVALVVDNRSKYPNTMMKVSAVTVTGRAEEIEPGSQFERWAALLTDRHPYLQTFVQAPSTALFRVHVVRYLHVTRFQEVRQWLPGEDG
jgi:nitroimidazol reductase NimA-like FMN-containing flavoprotein (pyridoxamine 5'-phosphate oxidase superfamily)